ncbi:porin [Succinatimonas hippei]|uniref:porin n=1 Tax=Succinatimonas hippei TaxID=626938 RepID=UPI002011CE8B|nr:porin [Succinatimonas hippei]MCL1603555.1 porin [Succinatimonas hippei]
MKKSLLALAVASVAFSSVATAATVYDKDGTSVEMYGRVQSVFYSTHAATNSYSDLSTQTSGRLGFNLRTPLTANIAAYANAEWDVADNDKTKNDETGDDSFDLRRLYVGTDFGTYGKLQAGRFEDAIYWNVTSYSDIYEDWGCLGQLSDGDKRDGMIMYSWSGYGINFMATYGTAKDAQSVEGAWESGESLDLDNAYAVGLGYTTPDVLFGPISINVGYGSANIQSDSAYAGNYDSYDNYAASLVWGSVDVGPYLAAVWNMRDFNMLNGVDDYTVQGVEAVVAYGFENGVSIRTGYQWLNTEYYVDNNKDADAHIIPVYVNYNVTPNFNVWAEARFDVGSDDEFYTYTGDTYDLTENVYSVGARYSF